MAAGLWSWLFPQQPSAPFRRPQRFPIPHPIFERRHENTSYKKNASRNLESEDPSQWGLRDFLLVRKNDGTYELPVGTRLYHGSTRGDLDILGEHADDRMTFFGLDALISIWYILEMDPYQEITDHGYLYTFEVTHPIAVTPLPFTGFHPKNMFGQCHDLDVACIHPQMAYHGVINDSPVHDLSAEVTLHMSHFKDHLRLLSVEKVQQKILRAFHMRRLREFHPSHAVGENLPAAYPEAPMTELKNLKGGHRRHRKTARRRKTGTRSRK